MELKENQIYELISAYLASFEHLPYGVVAVKNDPFTTLICANSAYYKLIGYTKEELLEKHQNHITDLLIDSIYKIAESQSTQEDYDMVLDLRLRKADGTILWGHNAAHYNAKLDVFFITVTDITDKMVASTMHLSFEAFQARNEILAYASEYTNECIIVSDVETDEIIYMNPSSMKLAGLQSESDWIGKTYMEIGFGSKDNVPPHYYEPLTVEFTSREYYNKCHGIYVHVENKFIDIPNLNRKMRLTIVTDITPQKQLEDRISMRTILHNCTEALFRAGVADENPDDAYYDILNQLIEYYQSDITFFYRFKNGTYEVENYYEVFADGVQEAVHTKPIVVPDSQIRLLRKLSEVEEVEYHALLNALGEEDASSLVHLHSAYQMKAFSCIAVKNSEGEVVAFMGIINPKTHADDKELMRLLSRFICMFLEHEQDQAIKDEALSIEEISKKTLADKCVKNFIDVTSSSENISDTLDALCLHYEADFSIVLISQDDGFCETSYIGGQTIPNLEGLSDQPRDIMKMWIEIFAKYPEIVSDADLTDPTSIMVKQLLKEKYGIYNFVVSPIKNVEGTVIGLLFVNNIKLLNRARLMVHVVAESISNYLRKIRLYESTQLSLLTRLANKTTMQGHISKLLEEGKMGALYIVNIDNFKQLNDTFGHHIGDQAIIELADTLKQIFRPTDIVGRIGGDEFMVFSPDLLSNDDIKTKAKQILEMCYHYYEKDGVFHAISTSVGICKVDEKYKTFQPLYENADYALYMAKKSGKHRYQIYTGNERIGDTSVVDEMHFYPNVVEKLQAAIHDHSFVVHYQPIYHVPTKSYTQAEALVRIAKPDGTLIYPNDFIHIAENSGLAVEMTYQILEQVCRDFRQLITEQPETTLTSIAINVPYVQFTDPEMENRFLEIIKKYDIAPSQIKLEITERLFITDMDLMMKKMTSLKAIGFEFELDDFGTDYSNLKMCVSLPLEIIKLDRSLLLAAMASDVDRRFFKHILSGLHDSCRHTIMEGVETQEQLEWTLGCQCEYIQGYYFSKPVDFEGLSQFLIGKKTGIMMYENITRLNKIDARVKSYILDYEHFPCGVAVIKNDDFSTLLRANPAFYKMIGYTKEEFLINYDNRMNNILVDDFFDVVQEQTTEKDYNIEWDIRLRTSNGTVKWIHDVAHYNSELNVFFVIFIDITDKMATASTELSYTAFQTKNEILLYLNKYLSKHFIVTDIETDEVVYMSASAMEASGFQQESDWYGKKYIELGFGSPENVRSSYYEPLKEDEVTICEYYNKFHKKHVRTENKIVTIPKLHRKLRLTIITDITAEKQLEQRMAFRTTLYHCIEALFTVGATNQATQDAYFEILNQLKAFYHADEAFFYKFEDKQNKVESVYRVLPNGEESANLDFNLNVSDEQIELLKAASAATVSEHKNVLEKFGVEYQSTLSQLRVDYKVNDFSCVTVSNAQEEIIAFIGVTNPQYNEDDKELLNLLSRFICMFIEHEQDDVYKAEALAREAVSKQDLVNQCVKNFQNITHSKANIVHTLEGLCRHYDADFAIIISRNEDNIFGVSYAAGKAIPDFADFEQSRHFMSNWLEILKTHTHFASDLDFDDEYAPMVKKFLLEKFGIYNFAASPMRDNNGELYGLLIVNNINHVNRSHLMIHVVSKDISDYLERVQMQKKIQLEPTTQLSNKVATQSKISKLLKNGNKGTLFIMDIDNFKELNDTLGHQIGDQAIVDIAEILKNISRTTDIVGRVGGDEFMVFCDGLMAENSINKKAQQLLESCQLVYKKGGDSVEISTSIGVCSVNDSSNTYDTLYTKADYALYESKRAGKNMFTIYTPTESN